MEPEDEIRQALINISALSYITQGWVDSLYPYRFVTHKYDPKIMPALVKTAGEAKITTKLISRQLVKNDDESVDTMLRLVGDGIGSMAKMGLKDRRSFIEELSALTNKYNI